MPDTAALLRESVSIAAANYDVDSTQRPEHPQGIGKVLGTISTSLAEGSAQVAAAASQVSAASQSLADGASQQAGTRRAANGGETRAHLDLESLGPAQKVQDVGQIGTGQQVGCGRTICRQFAFSPSLGT